jgi:hypothetical protein
MHKANSSMQIRTNNKNLLLLLAVDEIMNMEHGLMERKSLTCCNFYNGQNFRVCLNTSTVSLLNLYSLWHAVVKVSNYANLMCKDTQQQAAAAAQN